MSNRMVTDDGWLVEVIVIDGTRCFRVSRHGTLVGRGRYFSIPELKKVMGMAFERLHDE